MKCVFLTLISCIAKLMRNKLVVFMCLLLIFSTLSFTSQVTLEKNNDEYILGVGQADITGPSAEIVMMGYADSKQSNRGIHLRQRARTFIIKHPQTSTSVVYVNVDLGMCFQSIKNGVVNKLADKGHGKLYHDKNIMINATHTHNGPGGYSHYGLYNVSTKGHIKENLDGIIEGITTSIIKAHNNLETGYIEYSKGIVLGINKNRSLEAYNNNPKEEREKYKYDIDKNMYVMNFRNSSGKLLGVLNWFAVHPTSMTVKNLLISSDNKGTASYLFEKSMNTDYSKDKTFVCAFAQSNCGDASPNHSEQDPKNIPDKGLARTYEIGKMQYEAAKKLSDNATDRLSGDLAFRHTYLDFSNIIVDKKYTGKGTKRTYGGCMGYSFAPGAEDNPTDLPLFYEGMKQPEYSLNDADNYIEKVQRLLNFVPKFKEINGAKYPKLWKEHYPKPILFATCKATPDAWTPQIIPIQLFTIGNVAIAGIPAEVTTMSARRLKTRIEDIFKESGKEYTAIISGLSNSYTSYLATPEEYDKQHYEGASTQFGKWTLPAYIQEFDKLALTIINDIDITTGLLPPDLTDKQVCFETPVIYDNTLAWDDFGDVERDVKNSYNKGETVKVEFWSGHPNNDFRHGGSFLEVQYKLGGKWITVAYDWDIETRYEWKRHSVILGTSISKVIWEIPKDALSGKYRIKHNGAYKKITGKIIQYHGYSREFIVK
ncbi:neutral/alkaline ceramidase [Clostridiaceae bacterium M8S5]|nr:neutral/alkaline ceramidase [Clostridiaceae bacterium M8S5]